MQNLKKLVPEFAKPVLRNIRASFVNSPVVNSPLWRKATQQYRSRQELHRYWKAPVDDGNMAKAYLEGEQRSRYLVSLIREHVQSDAKILEIGCNIGRNLHYLHQSGFHNLNAIEISENAVHLLKENFPEMPQSATIHNSAIEDVIKTFRDSEFDVVYTMAVLEHIHTESEWIFAEMKRIAGKVLITIEDEQGVSWRHFPRNYQQIFESLGLKQVKHAECVDLEGLGKGFFARVFVKA